MKEFIDWRKFEAFGESSVLNLDANTIALTVG